MMTALPNTAFYQAGTIQVQMGIRMSIVPSLIDGTRDQGILLGTRRLCDSIVIRPLKGLELPMERDKLMQASITYHQAPGQDCPQPHLTRYAEDGKHLVLVQTGFRTNSNQLQGNRAPFFHGVLPMTDGAHEVATWCSQEYYPGSDVPTRRMSLFELSEGAKLFVSDIFKGPDYENLIVVKDGSVYLEDVPRSARGLMEIHGRELLALADEKRLQRRAA